MNRTHRNRKIVEETFAAWSQKRGSIFDILAPAVSWTILGRHSLSQTYQGKEEFLEKIIKPFLSAFTADPTQTLRSITAEDERVHLAFSVTGPLRGGTIYSNDLSWLLWFEAGLVIRAEALLDLEEFARAMRLASV